MQLLDLRSFSSIWYWTALLVAWTVAGRTVLGVPGEYVYRARMATRDQDKNGQGSDAPAAASGASSGGAGNDGLILLDWLSLNLPRWKVTPFDGALLLGVATFLLSSLMIMGFVYWVELAQAAFLLVTPFAILLFLRVRLADSLQPVLAAAHAGAIPPREAARQAARAMHRHRIHGMILSALSVAVAAVWGTWWVVTHPYGF